MKKKTLISLFAVGAVAAGGLATPSFAADTKEQPAPQAEKGGKKQPFSGKVEAVDTSANTMTVGGSLIRILTETKLTKEGKDITLGDVKVGEEVNGTGREGADGKTEALTVKVRPATEEKPQAPKY